MKRPPQSITIESEYSQVFSKVSLLDHNAVTLECTVFAHFNSDWQHLLSSRNKHNLKLERRNYYKMHDIFTNNLVNSHASNTP